MTAPKMSAQAASAALQNKAQKNCGVFLRYTAFFNYKTNFSMTSATPSSSFEGAM